MKNDEHDEHITIVFLREIESLRKDFNTQSNEMKYKIPTKRVKGRTGNDKDIAE